MPTPRTTAESFRLRTLVQWCVFFLLAAGLVETWLVGGLVVPCRIVGGSMAGALLGTHCDVVCGDCGCPFACGMDVSPPPVRAVCPNCGHAANDLESLPGVNGQRVLIDRTAFSVRWPRRWEIVAFHGPSQSDKLLVKRVVGLPGESIEIRGGDVYVDGRIQRKDLAQQRALAVLVYDSNFRPMLEPTPPLRWRPDRSDSRWSPAGGRFAHAADPTARPEGDSPIFADTKIGTVPAGQPDWLVYHHWQRTKAGADVRQSPVTDVVGYNQSQPRREEDVHAISDLILSFRLGDVSGHGTFRIRIADGYKSFETQLQFVNDGSLVRCSTMCQQMAKKCEIPAARGERLVEVSLVDQQFLLAVDGYTIVTWPYDRPDPPPSPPASPLAIGAEGIAATVRDLRVFRDVYYTHPAGSGGAGLFGRPMRLSEGQYYVLGDNSPVSEDSRTWPTPGTVDAKLLVGKPLATIPSVPLPLWGRSYFQVPNPMEIRYIR